MILDEAVNVFRYIEDYNYYDKQTDGKEECANKFFEYIPVEFSHRIDFLYFMTTYSSLSGASCRATRRNRRQLYVFLLLSPATGRSRGYAR